MKKWFLSTMMALVLALSLLPVSALAAEVTVPANGSLQDAINSASSGDTITVTVDITSSVPITIANKSLTIVGSGDTEPTIDAIFQIAHTDNGGPYTVTFENIKFAPTVLGNVITEASTNATSADNVNHLVVENCEFELTQQTTTSGTAGAAVVAIAGHRTVDTSPVGSDDPYETGAQLIFRNNEVKTASYENSDSPTGYYTTAISTSVTGSSAYGNNVYSHVQHIIDNNRFLGHFYYCYVGGCAQFTNNTVDLSYYTEKDKQDTTTGRALQIRGAQADNNGGQLDLTVTGNSFSNMKQFLKLYELDSLLTAENGYYLNIADSGTENDSNTFTNIPELGEVEATSFSVGV